MAGIVSQKVKYLFVFCSLRYALSISLSIWFLIGVFLPNCLGNLCPENVFSISKVSFEEFVLRIRKASPLTNPFYTLGE